MIVKDTLVIAQVRQQTFKTLLDPVVQGPRTDLSTNVAFGTCQLNLVELTCIILNLYMQKGCLTLLVCQPCQDLHTKNVLQKLEQYSKTNKRVKAVQSLQIMSTIYRDKLKFFEIVRMCFHLIDASKFSTVKWVKGLKKHV